MLKNLILNQSIKSINRFGTRSLSYTLLGPKSLDNIVKLDQLKVESNDNIIEIWKKFHETKKDAISDILTPEVHTSLLAKAKNNGLFIVPVFKQNKDNYFILLSQFQDKYFLCTYLEGNRLILN